MQPGNPIVGGIALRIPAIRSPNYVAGTSGWTINQDGTAEFQGATIDGGSVIISGANGELLVYNPTPGVGNLRVSIAAMAGTDPYGNAFPAGIGVFNTSGALVGVLQSSGSLITLYNTSGQVIGTWGQTGLQIQFTALSGHQTIVGLTLSPALTFFSQDLVSQSGNANVQMTVTNGGLINEFGSLKINSPVAGSGNFAEIDLNGQSDDGTIPATITVNFPVQIAGETWHALSLVNGFSAGSQAGWNSGIRYRKLGNGDIEFDGIVSTPVSPGGKIIGTFPAGYRPSAFKLGLVLYLANSPKLADWEIDSSGNLTFLSDYGNPAVTSTMYVTGHFSTQ